MIARTANTPKTAPPPATSAIGSWNGMASQLSLPSISTPRLRLCRRFDRVRLRRRRTPGAVGARLFGGTCRRHLDDPVEHFRIRRAIGGRRHRLARLRQLRISAIVERPTGAAHLLYPAVEVTARHGLHDKAHVGKAFAAE